jgi:tetratricopeptide (TPR) repeat protein
MTANPLLFVTGDMTWSGTEQELNASFENVIDPIRKTIATPLQRVFICPGNHEIARQECQALVIRGYLKENDDNISKLFRKDNPHYELLIRAFSSYASFHRRLFPNRVLHDPGLFYVENLSGLPFSIISLNTAWAGFGGNEDWGNLFIGVPQISNAFSKASPENSIIVLSHHPLVQIDTGCFAEALDSHQCLSTISNRCSFVFSGHIHQPGNFSMVDFRGALGVSLAGAFYLDELHPFRPLTFSAGWMDTESNTCRSHVFTYQPPNQLWICGGDTGEQRYRIPSRPASLKHGEYGIKVPSAVKPPTKVRQRDYELVKKTLAPFGDTIRVLWVTGFPGIGKTTFSFHLSEVLFDGKKPIHLQRGDENDLKAIARAIRIHSPQTWFEAWKKHGDVPIEKLGNDDLIEIIGAVLRASDIWFIVEAGESYNEINKPCLCNFLDTVIATGSGVRAIVTTRERPQGISQPPHLLYELDRFTLDDTKHLVSDRTKCSAEFAKVIHERFHGHPLSISAFLAQITEPELSKTDEDRLVKLLQGVPFDTSNLLESLWSNLSEKGKRTVSAIAENPELGIPSVVSACAGRELERSGILSTYPSSLPNGVRYYVHPLVSEVCGPLIGSTERQKGKYEALEAAYGSGLLDFGPLLAKTALEIGDMGRCTELIESDGRTWIEVSGIERSARVIETFLNLNRDYPHGLYLLGLCRLFAGEYQKAESVFLQLISVSSLSESFRLAVRAEVMECFRRQGMIFEAFSELVELLPRWRDQTKVEDPWNLHFLGVCGFLIGHLMRSLGAYEKAAEVYSLAEAKFLSSPILSSVVERMHCQYARGLAQATCSLAHNVDFRKDFEQSTVRSDFLQGLACYLFAGSEIRQGNYAEAQNTLGRARFHFQRFSSFAYDCRVLCMLGITWILLGNNKRALENFAEVIRLSDHKSPQYQIANALEATISRRRDYSQIVQNSLSNLLRQGKLATAATLISTYLTMTDNKSDFLASNLAITVYLLDTLDEQVTTVRIDLNTVEDAIGMLLNRLKIVSINDSFPAIE